VGVSYLKVIFVYKDDESLAIEYLSAVLKQHGHETSLAYESFLFDNAYLKIPAIYERANRPAKVAAQIARKNPDLVAFSVWSDCYQWMCQVAKELKKISGVPTVFGGIHVTALPEQVIKHSFVDFVVVGEGEYALLELADGLEQGKDVSRIPNVWSKLNGDISRNPPRPAIEELDSLPFPDKEIFIKRVPVFREIYSIATSRGCPNACTYCCNNLLHKLYGSRAFFRRRSCENVIEELLLAKEKQPFKMVFFVDDDFISDRRWLERFLDLYKSNIGTIFRCAGHGKHINEDVAMMLADAGCRRIEIGVQTWNERLKRQVCHRHESNEQIIKACKAIKKAKIYLDMDQIFGLPLHEEEDYIEALRQYSRIRPNNINCFWLRYYPGTEIIDIARANGLLDQTDLDAIEGGTERNY
jgi:radical SAM superfamily enzyme YgiQ (UPF0313 family)